VYALRTPGSAYEEREVCQQGVGGRGIFVSREEQRGTNIFWLADSKVGWVFAWKYAVGKVQECERSFGVGNEFDTDEGSEKHRQEVGLESHLDIIAHCFLMAVEVACFTTHTSMKID